MRETAINSARVYLTEARNRRHTTFFWVLMGWARNARLRAAKPKPSTAQGSLF